MKLVVIESPYAGNVEENIAYARSCIKDSLNSGESPIASHLIYTQEGILDDLIAEERTMGVEAGFAWYRVAEVCAVYYDLGVSENMWAGVARAKLNDIEIVYRSLRH